MKQRLYWLDNIKAFCIIAVVISHVNSFVFHNGASFINQVIDPFFMGGFFMVSGYLASKHFADQVSWKSLLKFNTYNLLIPLVIVGTLYALITDLAKHGGITSNPFVRMISNGDQLGYWFLLTIFIFKMMSMLTGLLAKSFRLQYHKIIQMSVYMLIYIVMGGGICLVIKYLFDSNPHYAMCLSGHIQMYMLMYLAGIILHNEKLFMFLQERDWVTTFMFAAGCVLCVCYDLMGLEHPLIIMTTYRMLIVVSMFVYFSKHLNKYYRCYTICGEQSLEIYVFHFFIIIGCSSYNSAWLEEITKLPIIFQLCISISIAICIILPTLGISNIVNNNKALRFILLGKRNNK